MQADEPVGRQEQVGTDFPQQSRNAQFKPDIPQERMPGWGRQHHGYNIFAEYYFIAVISVENKVKGVFGVILYDPAHGLVGEPSDPVKLTRH
jgi:hypothetical protein